MNKSGFFMLTCIIIFWVLLLWASFSLILVSQTDSILNSSTKAPAETLEKLYFAGYTLSTLGSGDFIPSSNFWRIITNVFSFTGLILLTMSVTYFVPLLQAVIEQQQLAVQIKSYGKSAQEILLNNMEEGHLNKLSFDSSLCNTLIKHAENHKAYPVIRFFHNSNRDASILLQLCKLHESLLLLKFYISPELKPAYREIRPLEVAFDHYIQIMKDLNVSPKDTGKNMPPLEFQKLKKAGLIHRPEIDKESIDNRKFFFELVKNDGWQWSDLNT